MNKKDIFSKHKVLWAAVCCILGLAIPLLLLTAGSVRKDPSVSNAKVMEIYERNLMDRLSTELGGNAPAVTHNYILHDSDMVAPEPDPACFGTAEDPAEMAAILNAAKKLLNIENTLFTTDTVIKKGSTIHYYLDETIFTVVWKQVIDDSVYTFSEVKIAHPSQFRRFFSEGTYNSGILHTTTEMAASVNAVTASSGDYHGYRKIGIVYHDGVLYRDRGKLLDTCYVDDKGNLLFTYRRTMLDRESIQKFIDDNNVRFTICFGPVMIVDGENVVPYRYNSGQIEQEYPRAALCQMGELHYVMVAVNTEDPVYYSMHPVSTVADRLVEMGIPTAYALDGGQTAAIVINDQLINTVSYGAQREISDIIYFATAVPDGK